MREDDYLKNRWEKSNNAAVRAFGAVVSYGLGLVIIAIVIGVPLIIWLLMGSPSTFN
jgi:hypothetical protein